MGEPKKTQKRALWKKLLIGFGALLVVTITIHSFVTRDIKPIDDSDLAIPKREVDASENPYPEIRAVSIDAETQEVIENLWWTYFRNERIDDNSLDSVLNNADASLVAFDQFAEKTDWKVDGKPTLTFDYPEIDWLNSLAKLKELEMERQIARSEMTEASKVAGSLIKVGKALQTCDGTIIYQLAGRRIYQSGLTGFSDVIRSRENSAEVIKEWRVEFDTFSFDTSGLENSLRAEYQSSVALIDGTEAGKIEFENGESIKPSLLRRHPLFFKPNRTKKLFADGFRDLILEASLVRNTAPNATYIRAMTMHADRTRLFLSGNPAGQLLFTMTTPPVHSLADINAQTRTNFGLVQLQFAMEQYRLEKRGWPENLESLVPEFIDSIPIDQMDGQPLRYNKDALKIYSVGADFIDSNGETEVGKTGQFEDRNESVIHLESEE